MVRLLVTVLLIILSAPPGFAEEKKPLDLESFKQECLASKLEIESSNKLIQPDTACFAGIIGCGQTAAGRVSLDSCRTSDNVYGVGYVYNGTAGQVLTVSARSFEFPMSLIVGDGREGNSAIYAQDHKFSNGDTASVTLTLPYTGPYLLIVSPLIPNRFGDYTIGTSCSTTTPPPPPPPPPPPTTGTCVQTPTSACLLGNRFRAEVRYRTAFDHAPVNATAFRKPVTGFADASFETAFFYFNSANNLELMVKMLDQGNTDPSGRPTIAVLFGTATPLRVEVTITDTRTGLQRTYVSAFPEMKGVTDFTAFVK